MTDVQSLLQTLANTLSPDKTLREPAERSLLAWQQTQGYCSALHQIVCDLSIGPEFRLSAAAALKNCTERWWKLRPQGCEIENKNTLSQSFLTSSRGLSVEEKAHLRVQMLLPSLEPERRVNFHPSLFLILLHQVSRTVALAVGKIARIDWPSNWWAKCIFLFRFQIFNLGPICFLFLLGSSRIQPIPWRDEMRSCQQIACWSSVFFFCVHSSNDVPPIVQIETAGFESFHTYSERSSTDSSTSLSFLFGHLENMLRGTGD